MVDKRGLGGLGGSKPKSRPVLAGVSSRLVLPNYLPPPPLSLQDRLPEGWATEGWPAQWPPPPASSGPVPGFNENQPFPPRNEQLVGYRPDQVGPYPLPYGNERLEQDPVYPEHLVPQMPPGWQPPLTLRQRIERGLEAQRQRRTEEPPATKQHPVLRRRKPKARESEA